MIVCVSKVERRVKKLILFHLQSFFLPFPNKKEPIDMLEGRHEGYCICWLRWGFQYNAQKTKLQVSSQHWNSPWPVNLFTSQLRSLLWDVIPNSLHLLVSIWSLSQESKREGYNNIKIALYSRSNGKDSNMYFDLRIYLRIIHIISVLLVEFQL